MLKALVATIALPFVVSTVAAQAPSPMTEARALWRGMIVNVTQAANEIPESMYTYRPTPDVRSFGEMFAHVAGAQKMFCAMGLGEKVPGEADVEKSAKTKAAIVAALKESTDYCERAYSQPDANVKGMIDVFGEQHTKLYALLMNATHDGEHYGNIVTYMRLNKLVPPSSRPRTGQ